MTERSHFRIGPPTPLLESVDDGLICVMRLTLALSALLIILIDPSEPDRLVAITYLALIIYSLYSFALYLSTLRGHQLISNKPAVWIDVGCFVVLVALSSGTNSIFFFFFFFAILVASFRSGFRTGFRVALVSALVFTVVGYVTVPGGPAFELNKFLLRPVYLLVLGYMISYWGGNEIRLKQRLSLLKEITTVSGPPSSVNKTIAAMLERIRIFYDADDCWLIMSEQPEQFRLFRFSRSQRLESVEPEEVSTTLAASLLEPVDDVAVVYQGKTSWRHFGDSSNYAFDLSSRKECSSEWQEFSQALAAKFEIPSFISIPVHYQNKRIGRFYLMGSHGLFDNSDVDFLMQVFEQMMPVIDNIRLVDRLASSVAEQERQRLARDIHDSVIQPYLGLQYKLAAIRNKIAAGLNVNHDIERLFQMTTNEVNTLRGFTRGLKSKDRPADNFLASVRRFAEQFTDNYNLRVDIESEPDISVSDQLAAELIQIVQEGLSNIRKHTEATSSKISLGRINGFLQLSIENSEDHQKDRPAFMPRSISERAAELGGRVDVKRAVDRTIVQVKIPF